VPSVLAAWPCVHLCWDDRSCGPGAPSEGRLSRLGRLGICRLTPALPSCRLTPALPSWKPFLSRTLTRPMAFLRCSVGGQQMPQAVAAGEDVHLERSELRGDVIQTCDQQKRGQKRAPPPSKGARLEPKRGSLPMRTGALLA
ncbi:hypothetical protein P7K49_028505, partial [Saguinus oedipus]